MPREAQNTDHGDFPDFVQKYTADRGKTKQPVSAPAPALPPCPLPPAEPPPRPDTTPPAASVPAPAVEAIVSIPASGPSVEDLKELERFRLGVWLAKLIVGSMMGLLFCVLGLYTWITYATKSLPDLGVLGTIFGHLKEVIVILIEAQK